MIFRILHRHGLWRGLSWLSFIFAFVGPVIWAWVQVSAFKREFPEPGCGMPILAIYILAVVEAGVLSLISGGLGWMAIRGLPKPCPRFRVAELVVLLAPAIVSVAVILLIAIHG